MTQVVLSAVCLLLIINVMVALIVEARRRTAPSWLLVILLSGTTGAAIVAVLSVLAGYSHRLLDVALVLTSTAAITALVRARFVLSPTTPDEPAPGSAAPTGRAES